MDRRYSKRYSRRALVHMTVRHTGIVRVTHWINTLAFLALVVSGTAILLAHPRLYWGETGAFGSPALIDLPLPLNLDQSGWGRSLHFLSAWICVVNGLAYTCSGLITGHFNNMPSIYSALQRSAYLIVVFTLLPLMILSGLAMSPAVTSAFPIFVRILGGYQSARTIHFFTTNILVMFLLAHVTMVYLSGFRTRMRGMITGHI
jgi:thiosulfate reductase cytochrome b subunit